MTTYKKAGVAVLGLSAILLSGNALAATQTLVGTNVTYVYDDDLMGLYGQPTLSGDSLVFTPINFKAQSTDGNGGVNGGIVQTGSTINVQVYANTNYTLSAFSLTELGDYRLIGSDAQVTVGGQMRLFDLDDVPPAGSELTDPITATAPLTVATSLTDWQANAAIAVPANWNSGVNLTIENILLARTTQTGSTGEIWKNTVTVNTSVSPVPEAETYAMILAGLGLVGFMARRRSLSVI